METGEKVKKHVRFAKDVTKNLIFTSLDKYHTSQLKKLWLERCREGKYEVLKQDIFSYENKGLTMEKFFFGEGETLLDWALSNASSAKQLQFISENIPQDLLQQALKQDNFYALDNFLSTEIGIEQLRLLNPALETPEASDNRLKKIKLLLTIDPACVEEFMEKNIPKEGVGQAIQASIEQALSEFKSIQMDLG